MRNTTDYLYFNFPGTGPYYLDREYDTLLAPRDHLIANQFLLLYDVPTESHSATLLIGPYAEWTRAIETKLTRQRVGITYYHVPSAQYGYFRQPRLYAQAGINLQDPNREGGFYAVLGIGGNIYIN